MTSNLKSHLKINIFIVFVVFLFACTTNVVAQEQIPILAWYSIPAEDATLERYQELKDAGFTITFSHTSRFEDAKKALDLAAKVGIKSMFTCTDLESDPESTVKKVKDHPGLAGYFLRDEPTSKDFPKLAEWANRIKAVDGIHHCYLNLFPNYVPEEALGETYEQHVHRFIKEVNLEMVSFDFYPIVKNQLRERWYDNLEVIAKESRAAGKPFWAFALTTAHDDYPIPDAAQLKLQMYSNLAYGAQCLQYFTYWNPDTTHWNFHEAPITSEKKRSPVYDLVRDVNKELQNRAFVFMGAHVVSVHHTGDKIPVGTKALTTLPTQVKSLDVDGDGAVVSLLEKDGYQYFVIVNRSFLNPLDLRIQFSGPAEVVRKDGSIEDANKYNSWFHSEPGEADIFRWKKSQ